jgi:hypothetical protein
VVWFWTFCGSYKQGQASFYLPRYPDLTPLMSGDERLGPIKENALRRRESSAIGPYALSRNAR